MVHTTSVNGANAVLTSGELMSSVDGITSNTISAKQTNSGLYCVSWSLNEVTAMPGTPYHIAGFLASPELDVENGNHCFVPVDAAVNEIQVLHKDGDVDAYREASAQIILWRKAVNEWHKIAATNGQEFETSNAMNTLKSMRKKIQQPDYELPFKFKGGVTIFNESMLDGQISPLAVLMMALAEGKDLVELGINSSQDLVASTNIDLLSHVASTLPVQFEDEINEAIEQLKQAASQGSDNVIRYNVESMTFLCGDRDFESIWKHVIASSKHRPEAVLLYPQLGEDAVKVPNFVLEKGLGDHDKLTKAIRRIIPDKPSLTFKWSELLPEDALQETGGSTGAARIFVGAKYTLRAKHLSKGRNGDKLVASYMNDDTDSLVDVSQELPDASSSDTAPITDYDAQTPTRDVMRLNEGDNDTKDISGTF